MIFVFGGGCLADCIGGGRCGTAKSRRVWCVVMMSNGREEDQGERHGSGKQMLETGATGVGSEGPVYWKDMTGRFLRSTVYSHKENRKDAVLSEDVFFVASLMRRAFSHLLPSTRNSVKKMSIFDSFDSGRSVGGGKGGGGRASGGKGGGSGNGDDDEREQSRHDETPCASPRSPCAFSKSPCASPMSPGASAAAALVRPKKVRRKKQKFDRTASFFDLTLSSGDEGNSDDEAREVAEAAQAAEAEQAAQAAGALEKRRKRDRELKVLVMLEVEKEKNESEVQVEAHYKEIEEIVHAAAANCQQVVSIEQIQTRLSWMMQQTFCAANEVYMHKARNQ